MRLTREGGTGNVHAQPLSGWRPDTCLTLRTTRQPADVADQLAEAYRKTTFRVLTPAGPIDIRVGQRCSRLNALLQREGLYCWAFLTAWNPGARVLPAAENQRRHKELHHRLRALGVPVLPGSGIGDDPNWPPEDSLLAVGLDRPTAAALAAEFGQDAIVVGDIGQQPELLWCRCSATAASRFRVVRSKSSSATAATVCSVVSMSDTVLPHATSARFSSRLCCCLVCSIFPVEFGGVGWSNR